MKGSAHFALEGGIDELMLAHPGHASERFRDDAGAIMVAVASQILDRDLGVGEGFGQVTVQGFDGHWHAKTWVQSEFHPTGWTINLNG